MSDLFLFCLIFIGFVLYYPHVMTLPAGIDLSLATPFLLQSIILVFLWYQTIRRFEFQWKLHRFHILTLTFGIFIVLSLIPVIHSVYHYDSMRIWTVFLSGFVLYLLVGNYQLKVLYEPEIELEFPQRKYQNGLLWLLVIFGVIESVYGFYQYTVNFDKQLQWLQTHPHGIDPRLYSGFEFAFQTKRILGTFGNPNLFAIVLAMIIPIGLGLLFRQKTILHKVIITLAIGAQLAAIFLSASRGGVIAFVVGVVFFFVFIGRKNVMENKTWLGSIVVIFLVILFLTQSLQTTSNESLSTRLRSGASTTQERIHYWDIAWQMIQRNPILGNGLGSYGILYGHYKPVEIGESRYTHNLFLQTWAEGGIFCFLALVGFLLVWLIYPFDKFKKVRRPEVKIQLVAFYSAMVAFLVDCFIGFGFYWPDVYYIFCIILAGLYATANAEFVPELSPDDIVWRRQPNTQFLLITPCVTLAIVLFWYTWIYNSFRGEIKFQEGRIHLLKHESVEAEKEFLDATHYIKCNSEYYQHLGNTLILRGDSQKGIAYLKQAVALNPYTAYYHADLAKAYFYSEQPAQSVEEYQKAIQCYPTKPDYHLGLSTVYQSMNNQEMAERELKIAEEIKARKR